VWRLLDGPEEDVPALAIRAGAAAESDGEGQVQGGNLPSLSGPGALHGYLVRLEKVIRWVVRGVIVLDPLENRELAPGSQMNLVLAEAVDHVVVHALGVTTRAGLLARLPVA